ncbi:B3 DOMAIN-CONTAINING TRANSCRIPTION FACTOR ABI3 [Salix viminalis]|uniref:B3 DOMAIN-CONTAINING TRANSCRIPTION FACTOR ABI3 n=1 Tax=Salix viminalis TaxID=40686 RepID=A0A9Q0V721_SALVM|nr:B3 DOMAIN-CONTAINING TRANSCRIPTION FACTOR ABI3 [Salix viminalis]
MEEETVSLVLNAETSAIEELSDSNSSTHPFPPSKRARSGSNVSASKFKGVVPQPNGHWGCQIYANHLRIWLGTFKSEKEAAMAYDSAATKLRSGDSRRNFPPTAMTVEEPKFQSYYSTEAVLSMIKDGSYRSKFADFTRTCSQSVETELSLKLIIKPRSGGGLTCKQLFRKELTPSDVGKLNRLVVPKKFAIKYFPHVSESSREDEAADKIDDVMLAFYDKSMKLWKFRYCYWKSSQSYVFTRGWNRFVKEKQLKANDTIVFCLCEGGEIVDSADQTFQMIDVISSCENSSNMTAESSSQSMASEAEVQPLLGRGIARDSTVRKNVVEEDRMVRADEPAEDAVRTGFKLFGIQIM